MIRKSLVLSILAFTLAGFAAAAWYATRPEPVIMSTSDSEAPASTSPSTTATTTTTPSGAALTTATSKTTVPKTTSSRGAQKQPAALQRWYSPIIGPEEAPVTIVEFFDPACEACRAFYPVVKDIMAKHGNSVRLVLRYTPFHGEPSEQAIRVLEAARIQDVYEPVLEAILREQPRWAAHGASEPGLILEIAANAGLNVDAAKHQIQAPNVAAVLDQDRADVQTMGVRQTPTFFVNGRPLKPFGVKELRALVAEEVAAAE